MSNAYFLRQVFQNSAQAELDRLGIYLQQIEIAYPKEDLTQSRFNRLSSHAETWSARANVVIELALVKGINEAQGSREVLAYVQKAATASDKTGINTLHQYTDGRCRTLILQKALTDIPKAGTVANCLNVGENYLKCLSLSYVPKKDTAYDYITTAQTLRLEQLERRAVTNPVLNRIVERETLPVSDILDGEITARIDREFAEIDALAVFCKGLCAMELGIFGWDARFQP